MSHLPPVARSRPRLLAAGLVLVVAGRLAPAARAQSGRPVPVPDNAELGRLSMGVFPQAALDGRPVQLGPGVRIFDEQNVIRPPATVTGERRVAYVRGAMGEVTQVWLVTDDEWRAISARIAAQRRAASQR